MPELPEVEIIKKSLIKNIKSRKINKVIVRNNRLRFKLEKNFKKILHRNKINNIYRFSKYIYIRQRTCAENFCFIFRERFYCENIYLFLLLNFIYYSFIFYNQKLYRVNFLCLFFIFIFNYVANSARIF